MLEGIGIELAVIQRLVRHHIIREFEDLDIEALWLGDFRDLFENLRMLARCNSDLDCFGQRTSRAEDRRQGRYTKYFLQHFILLLL